jgi:hypothetical protein
MTPAAWCVTTRARQLGRGHASDLLVCCSRVILLVASNIAPCAEGVFLAMCPFYACYNDDFRTEPTRGASRHASGNVILPAHVPGERFAKGVCLGGCWRRGVLLQRRSILLAGAIFCFEYCPRILESFHRLIACPLSLPATNPSVPTACSTRAEQLGGIPNTRP